ncbi:MAG: carboxypeptidase-like regulatory domain-containing protein [Bryobacteraceae bacterium]
MIALLVGGLMAALPAAGAQAAGAYGIAGVVLNAASGQPVAGARVTLASVERRDQRLSAVSGDDGRFAFKGLPQGKYELSGQRRGLLAGNSTGMVVAGPGQNTDNIVLRLSQPAVISGKVVDDAGEPVTLALVELLVSRLIDGHRSLIEAASKRTDDTGGYRFSGLPAGSYYLIVSGVPWYAKFNEMLGDSAPRSMTHTGYAIRYHPNVGDPGAAEPLILKAGQEATANFTVLPVPAVSVYVHCEQGESLTKQYTLTTAGLPGNPVHVREGSETGDLYNLWDVLPGHYTLRAETTDGSHTWYGTDEFDVAAADMDVSVSLHEAPSLSGTVVLENGESPPAQLTVRLYGESGRSQPLALDSGARFSIPAIPPGRYRIGLSGADEFYLRSWFAEGGRREGEMLDIPAGAAVRLNLSAAKGARISGTVNRDGQPLPGALVVLTPGNRAMPSNSDGSYEFRGLAPGEYALFAVEDGADLEYANPAAIRPYLGSAKKARVAPGSSDNLRLDVAK